VARERTWSAEEARSSVSPCPHLPPPPPLNLLAYSPSATVNHHATLGAAVASPHRELKPKQPSQEAATASASEIYQHRHEQQQQQGPVQKAWIFFSRPDQFGDLTGKRGGAVVG